MSTPTTPPKCPCGSICVLRKVSKEGKNQGKYFWTCPGNDSDHEMGKKHFAFTNFTSEVAENIIKKQREAPRETPKEVKTNKSKTSLEVQIVDQRHPDFPKNKISDSITEWISISPKLEKSVLPVTDLSTIFSKITSMVHDVAKNTWFVPLLEYDKCILLLKSSNYSFDPIPKFVLDTIKDLPKETVPKEPAKWSKIPQNIRDSLLPFQKHGVWFGIQQKGKLLIGDDMGLGKSIQSIAISFYYRETAWPLLVLCPSALKQNWKNEFGKWVPKDIKLNINEVDSGKEDLDGDIVIISYTLASREPMLEKIANKKFRIILCDESHFLKELKSKRTSGLTPILKSAKHLIFLSGTSSPSRPIEMFAQLKALDVLKWKKSDFGDRYCDRKDGKFGVDYTGSGNLYELNLILSRTVLIRRLKRDVLKDLPKKERKTVFLNLSTSKMDELTKMKKSGDMSRHLEYWKKTGELKLDEIDKYLQNEFKTKRKFLLFAHHISVMDGLEKCLNNNKIAYIRIDGNTPNEKRVELANSFRGDVKIQVALLSITVAGTGLSFTPCSQVIFAELHWTPGLLCQAEDRVHRIGQTNEVDIRYLIAKKTIDEQIWKNIQLKLEVVGTTLDAEETKWSLESQHYDPDQKSIQDFFKKLGETIDDVDDDVIEVTPNVKRPIEATSTGKSGNLLAWVTRKK
jgi:SWI/SNF-related matrix-associated actin-dependent regulator 1 of chromatin subfamily A